MIIHTRKYSYYADAAFRNEANPGLLIMHGFMGCGAVFSHLGDELRNFSDPLLLDLIGHGDSDKPYEPEAYTTENQVDELAEIIRNSGLEKPVLHGYSMGGRLAIQFALKYPDLIRGLILESTTAGLKTEIEQKKRIASDEELARNIETDFENFLKEWKRNPLFGDLINPDRVLSEAFQESQQPECMAASLRGFGTGIMPSAWDKLENISLPVFLIGGADDHKFSMIMMEMDTLFEYSRLLLVPNAAHRVNIDQPDAYIDAIHSYFSETIE